MRVGEVITQYREEHRLSQREFARRCGLSNAQIAFMERGYGTTGKPFEPTFDTLRKIARAMGTTPEVLMAECDEFRANGYNREYRVRLGMTDTFSSDFLRVFSLFRSSS